MKFRIRSKIRDTAIKLGYYVQPDFIVIGAQKAGTSALFNILNQHPQIIPPLHKELHYFDNWSIKYGNKNAYHKLFPMPHELFKNKITYEVSPSYLNHPCAAERMFYYNPSIKLITILRNPISRAVSAYNFYKKFQSSTQKRLKELAEYRPMLQAFEDELKQIDKINWFNDKRSYLKRGIYHEQLIKYLTLFEKDQILIISYDEYCESFDTTLKRICVFLNIDQRFQFKNEIAYPTKYSEEISIDLKESLEHFFKPHNEKLFRMLDMRFSW